jgi:hypothetical protein
MRLLMRCIRHVLCLLSLSLVSHPTSAAEHIDWPQELKTDNGTIILIYQPQIEELTGNRIESRTAVSIRQAGNDGEPVFGAIWLSARLDTDRQSRTAVIRDLDVADVRLADASPDQREALARFIEESIEGVELDITLDQILADLGEGPAENGAPDLNHSPPQIILSTDPALLVMIDGEPVFQDIENSGYERVVNSPFLIVRDQGNLYLYVGSNAWFAARDVKGPWQLTNRIPQDIQSLVEPVDDSTDLSETRIIVATEPTELLVTDGEPDWAPVEGMDLLYLANTDSHVFLELSTQRYYLLLSGRWYRSEGVVGELTWNHVPNDELPQPFAEIPEDSVNAPVLAQVADTQAARDAVLDNTIPQTAAIDRNDTSFEVHYDGEPDFAPIEDIQVAYAQNTAAAVFRYGSRYYACDDGVWYASASPTGGWEVATEVPDAIYRIPADNPHYNVTYVKLYDVTPEVVYVGYTPGYYGSYYAYGTVVYGTGWYYRPWYGPYYYPRYPTWGFHVTYNPWTGWGFGVSWTNGPFRFTFSTGGAWWGVGGFRPYPRPYVRGGYRKTNINVNIDNSINIGGGNRQEARPSVYDRPENRARNADRAAVAADRRAKPAGNAQNNVLTDRSGNIYQRNASGSWAQRENGQWNQATNLDRAGSRPSTRDSGSSAGAVDRSASRPSTYQQRPQSQATRPQLERDYRARQQGASRSHSFQSRASMRRR